MSPRARFQALAFLGAFLGFCLEPAAAKLLLPRFGGSAFVWTGAMMFFQAVLLLAYLYGRAAPRRPLVHAVVLALPLLFFPLSLPAANPAAGPLAELLRALAWTVGVPFFAVSTTVVVAQSWLMNSSAREREDAYFLYAASNAGAAAALLAYPFVIEPLLSLPAQGRLWGGLYAAYALLCAACAAGARVPVREEPSRGAAPSARDRALWLLLSAVPCAALLAATNFLSLDFAAVPLLWIVPLAVYLLTLVLNFKRKPWYPESLEKKLLPIFAAWVAACALVIAGSAWLGGASAPWQILSRLLDLGKFGYILFALFALSMIFHRSLAAGRPGSQRAMAEYYAWMAGGGLLGSAIVGLAVPLLGRDLGATALDWGAVAALATAAMAVRDWEKFSRGRAAAGVAVLAVAVGLAVAAAGRRPGTVLSLRNFYGIYSVEDRDGVRYLFHGNTDHGMESLDPARRAVPLAYYGFASPLGDAWMQLGGGWRSVGVVGLGAGSLASYGRPGGAMDFYELDPDIVAIARERFDYLRLCPSAVRIVTGDARLSLENAEGASYDVLVLDAFNSGAVPIHLLTVEAFRTYLRRLKPGGVILLHASNRYLDLSSVLAAAARETGLRGAAKRESFDGRAGSAQIPSAWAALSADPEKIRALIEKKGWLALDSAPRAAPWTDRHASLLPALMF